MAGAAAGGGALVTMMVAAASHGHDPIDVASRHLVSGVLVIVAVIGFVLLCFEARRAKRRVREGRARVDKMLREKKTRVE